MELTSQLCLSNLGGVADEAIGRKQFAVQIRVLLEKNVLSSRFTAELLQLSLGQTGQGILKRKENLKFC